MNELVASIAEILEVDELDLTQKFTDYEEWDSLSALSVIALLNSEYGIEMKSSDIIAYENIGAFCDDVIARKK